MIYKDKVGVSGGSRVRFRPERGGARQPLFLKIELFLWNSCQNPLT